MPIIGAKGSPSSQGFGQFAQANAVANYIEDVFSTYLFSTSATSTTVNNGIDLSTKGGMVWSKPRNTADSNYINYTDSGAPTYILRTQSTAALANESASISSFNTNGFTGWPFGTGYNFVSWTFRKQPKFFDVVTYTGNGVQSFPGRAISHNLGSVPGCIIIKNLSRNVNWHVEHRGANQWIPGSYVRCLALNLTAAQSTSDFGIGCLPIATSTTFNVVGSDDSQLFPVNYAGDQYVAYLFAHDAGGFGLTGTDNVISCGSYTGNGSVTGPVVTLGYEPQWLMIKNASGTGNWAMLDTMRGFVVGTGDALLFAESSAAEAVVTADGRVDPTATGFNVVTTSTGFNTNGSTYIYIAIRRGPMKVPTSGTSVFSPLLTSTTSGATNTTGFPVDSQFLASRGGSVFNSIVSDRLRGVSSNSTETGRFLVTSAISAENTSLNVTKGWNNTAFLTSSYFAGSSYITWNFGRAPSFFDEVCYSGTGSPRGIPHNLKAVPEIIILKRRTNNGSGDSDAPKWTVWHKNLPANTIIYMSSGTYSNYASNSYYPSYATFASTTTELTIPTLTNGQAWVNSASETYVAYLFATCAGVSKVGSYTGTGTTQQINCGFTGGARFVLIKRIDSNGDWYVYDSARGIVSGDDPYLLLNSTAAEVTNTDYVDTYSAGFEISSTAPAAINASGGTFIFLAIA